jgi:hypothetical protein
MKCATLVKFREAVSKFPTGYTHHTGGGGGCTAWRLDYNGGHLLVTDDAYIPEPDHTGTVCVGVYPDSLEGDFEALLDDLPVEDLSAWIDEHLRSIPEVSK